MRWTVSEEGGRSILGDHTACACTVREQARLRPVGIEVSQSSIAEPAGLLTGDVLIGAASRCSIPQDLLKALAS